MGMTGRALLGGPGVSCLHRGGMTSRGMRSACGNWVRRPALTTAQLFVPDVGTEWALVMVGVAGREDIQEASSSRSSRVHAAPPGQSHSALGNGAGLSALAITARQFWTNTAIILNYLHPIILMVVI